jgi:hypothetical protein
MGVGCLRPPPRPTNKQRMDGLKTSHPSYPSALLTGGGRVLSPCGPPLQPLAGAWGGGFILPANTQLQVPSKLPPLARSDRPLPPVHGRSQNLPPLTAPGSGVGGRVVSPLRAGTGRNACKTYRPLPPMHGRSQNLPPLTSPVSGVVGRVVSPLRAWLDRPELLEAYRPRPPVHGRSQNLPPLTAPGSGVGGRVVSPLRARTARNAWRTYIPAPPTRAWTVPKPPTPHCPGLWCRGAGGQPPARWDRPELLENIPAPPTRAWTAPKPPIPHYPGPW